jgi:hypothetical protein
MLLEDTMNTNHLEQVQQGMKVVDRLQHEIGKVDYVKLSDDDPTTPEVEAAEPDRSGERRETIIDTIADVFHPDDDLPEAIRARLLQQGFIRIDSAGLFAADRYVTPDQILSVAGDTLTLNVSRDELVKQH